MTFDLGGNALLAVLIWRWLTIAIADATGPEEVHIYRPNEEEEDRYGRD